MHLAFTPPLASPCSVQPTLSSPTLPVARFPSHSTASCPVPQCAEQVARAATEQAVQERAAREHWERLHDMLAPGTEIFFGAMHDPYPIIVGQARKRLPMLAVPRMPAMPRLMTLCDVPVQKSVA